MHYFTADLHLGHAQVMKHDGRPFDTIEEHDREITLRCRPESVHRPVYNELWILGDVAMNDRALTTFMEGVRPHWRKIHLIRGNHDDRVAWKLRQLFDSAQEAFYLRIDPQVKLYLSHYAHRVWRNSHHGSYHIHGHSHGALPRWGRSIDVGIHLHDYRPLSVETIVDRLGGQLSINHHGT